MNPDSLVILRKLAYRGVPDFHLSWEEDGQAREASYQTEAEAVVEMAAIEERLRAAVAAGKGLTVNPFGAATPFITSKDVHFASLRLQPRGLEFRTVITEHVEAVLLLKPVGASVVEAARGYAEACAMLQPFDVSVTQAVFEWVELKKQVGDLPLFELLRAHVARKAAEAMPSAPLPSSSPENGPASGASSAPAAEG